MTSFQVEGHKVNFDCTCFKEVGSISKGLKTLAMDLKVPIIALS